MELSDNISSLPGIGEKLTQAFANKNVLTIYDLLFYLPRRYEDYSNVSKISNLRPGLVTIKARILNISVRRARRGLLVTEAVASDSSGSVRVVWFNQPYRKTSIKADCDYYISGNFKLSNSQFSLINPSLEQATNEIESGPGIVPIYSESKSLGSWQVRKSIKAALPLAQKINEFLPSYILDNLGLIKISQAIPQVHFPENTKTLEVAKTRLKFDDLFPLLLANELNSLDRRSQKALIVNFNLDLARRFVDRLPFKLTNDQRMIIWQIYKDMQSDLPMNRLVEGDVGSGKTVVAVMAAVMALEEGYKVAFMAPTELLAKQHYETVFKLLKPLGMEESLFLLTGSLSLSQKRKVIDCANDKVNSFVVGTHSLLTSGVRWDNLALIIIDEQHRFGVDQRMELQRQTGHLPHFLSITATPIPRSLALTIFNDLDLSVLREMPANRRPVTTRLIPPSSNSIQMTELRNQLEMGRQIYVVCPHIHSQAEDDELAAEKVYQTYSKVFNDYSVGLLHGQMKSNQQDEVMKDFIDNKINLLVATTVIEVGVDVANASVMVIYGPDHFGLAQLHQLRGRVGRGNYDSYCYLMLSDSLVPNIRLRSFANIDNGFKLSELDLKLRGPGVIYGKLQHGKGFSRLLTLDDQNLIKMVKKGVKIFIDKGEKLLKYPELQSRVDEARRITYLN